MNIRMPETLKTALEEAARANGRSLTAEIVSRLDETFLSAGHLRSDALKRQTDEIHLRLDRLEEKLKEDWFNEEIKKIFERVTNDILSGKVKIKKPTIE